jgi:hypothetical protein
MNYSNSYALVLKIRLLKNHPTFSTCGKKQRKHFSTELHLLVLLNYLGSDGNSCNALNLKKALALEKAQ